MVKRGGMFSRKVNIERRKFDIHFTVHHRTFDWRILIFWNYWRFKIRFTRDFYRRGVYGLLQKTGRRVFNFGQKAQIWGKKSEIWKTIRKFGKTFGNAEKKLEIWKKNRKFGQKSKTYNLEKIGHLVNNLQFGKNRTFGQKSTICKKSDIWSKIYNLEKIGHLVKNLQFGKNRTFGQKSDIWSKIYNLTTSKFLVNTNLRKLKTLTECVRI